MVRNAGLTKSKISMPNVRTAHRGLLQKRLEEDLCWLVPHVPPMTQLVKALRWTEPKEIVPKQQSVSVLLIFSCVLLLILFNFFLIFKVNTFTLLLSTSQQWSCVNPPQKKKKKNTKKLVMSTITRNIILFISPWPLDPNCQHPVRLTTPQGKCRHCFPWS